jgi:hypothetical protein
LGAIFILEKLASKLYYMVQTILNNNKNEDYENQDVGSSIARRRINFRIYYPGKRPSLGLW